MSEKHERLVRWCAERGVDGVWLRRRANVAWLTDGADVHCDLSTSLGVASIVWTPERTTVLTDDIERARLAVEEFAAEELAAEELAGGVEVVSRRWWETEPAPEGRFACDWPDDVVASLRFAPTALEIERVRALGRDAASAVEGAMRRIARGAREHAIAALAHAALRERGIHAVVVLVGADERIALYRHPIPTEKRVERAVMLSVCAERRGLIVTLTRLVHFGALTADLRRRHDAVCRVDEALHAATRPGRRWCDALRAGLDAYVREGFADEWRLHHQGGPMGYAARDFKATLDETRTIEASQITGWNPSITGTKSEDTILAGGEIVTATGEWPLVGTRPDVLRLA